MGKSNKKINADRINALRTTYESLMDDERRRKDRNEQIIGILDKMRMTNTVALRSPFSRYYDDYQLRNVSPTSHLSDDLRRQKFNEKNQTRPMTPVTINNINEDIILKEMSKKYIIIPKLRHANITLQYETAVDSTSPITTNNNESDDWKHKYEILNQLKTGNETNNPNPYVMEAERDEKTKDEELSKDSKFNKESEYSTVTKLVADAQLPNVVMEAERDEKTKYEELSKDSKFNKESEYLTVTKLVADAQLPNVTNNVVITNLANDFAEITAAENVTLSEKLDANKQINELQPSEEENREVIYANVATAKLEANISYDGTQQYTEYRAPDYVTIDPQNPEPRTFDDREEEVNEIESNLRFDMEQSIDNIPNNEIILPANVSHYNENANNTADLDQYNDNGESPPEDFVRYGQTANEYQNSEMTTNETQNYGEMSYQNYEAQSNELQTTETSKYQNNVNETSHYQNSEIEQVKDNPIYEVNQPNIYENYNQNTVVSENQYQNYDVQQDDLENNYSNQYPIYEPEQIPVEQAQIDEFNEENNTMFYSENNDEVVYQQPQLQEPELVPVPEFDQNQYVYDTENDTMQPYDQSYEQQYSGLAYDPTQEVPNPINQGDGDNVEKAYTDYGVAEVPDKMYVEQVKDELDSVDGLNVSNQPETQKLSPVP